MTPAICGLRLPFLLFELTTEFDDRVSAILPAHCEAPTPEHQ
jgi:hypothetical protein